MKRTILTIAAAIAATTMALAVAGTAAAASGVSTSGAPGKVYEASIPVTCSDWGNLYNHTGLRDVVINGPTVYGRLLSNGSTWQYVRYQVDIKDLTTNQLSVGIPSQWYAASTTTGVRLPQMSGAVPIGHLLAVDIHIFWWDPVSAKYTGTMDYRVNAYYNFNYSPPLFRSTYC